MVNLLGIKQVVIMIWTAVLIGAVPMAVTVYVAQNLLKNQRPVVYYGGLIGAGLLAWQITEWLDRQLRPRLTQMEMDRISHISRMENRIEELESKYSAESKKCCWCGEKGVCCTDEDSKNSVSNITNKYGEKVVDAWPMGNPDEIAYVCQNCCFIHGDRSILIPNLIESTELNWESEYDNFGEINCEDCGGAIKVLYQVGSDGPEQGWCDC